MKATYTDMKYKGRMCELKALPYYSHACTAVHLGLANTSSQPTLVVRSPNKKHGRTAGHAWGFVTTSTARRSLAHTKCVSVPLPVAPAVSLLLREAVHGAAAEGDLLLHDLGGRIALKHGDHLVDGRRPDLDGAFRVAHRQARACSSSR